MINLFANELRVVGISFGDFALFGGTTPGASNGGTAIRFIRRFAAVATSTANFVAVATVRIHAERFKFFPRACLFGSTFVSIRNLGASLTDASTNGGLLGGGGVDFTACRRGVVGVGGNVEGGNRIRQSERMCHRKTTFITSVALRVYTVHALDGMERSDKTVLCTEGE
jgi:hypothetical protein